MPGQRSFIHPGVGVQDVPGADNIVADILSRDTVNCLQSVTTILLSTFAKFKPQDDDCIKIQDSPSLRVQHVKIPGGMEILVDASTGRPRILVPADLRRVMEQVHSLEHPRICGTKRLKKKAFLWTTMSSDVKKFVEDCDSCHKSKILKHTSTQQQTFAIPTRRFSFLHLDLAGPLPEAGGVCYFLSMIDQTSHWFEIVPLQNIEAKTVCSAFINHWISRYGVPTHILTDRGLQFTSHMMQQLCKMLGIQIHHTTAYHPQANGMVERLHQMIKESLTARGGSWIKELPWTLLGLRAVPREDDGISAAERVFVGSLVLPGSLLEVEEASSAKLAQAFRDLSGGVPV